MSKNCIAFLLLVCVCNALYCMNESACMQGLNLFMYWLSENPEIILPIAQKCFEDRPFMTRRQFINCLRPVDRKHVRATGFPLKFIDALWKSYSVVCSAAIVKSSRFFDEFCSGDMKNFSAGREFTSTLYGPNGTIKCPAYNKEQGNLSIVKIDYRFYFRRVDFDNSGMQGVELMKNLAHDVKNKFAKGYDVIVLVDHNNALDIIFANHNKIVFLISRINAFRLLDRDQILRAVDCAIRSGNMKRYNSLIDAMNAYQNSLG